MDGAPGRTQGAPYRGGFLFRNDPHRLEPGESEIAPPKPQRIWLEVLLWSVALLLVCPLLLYATSEVMPLWTLFAVAAGIALALALAGRQMHEVLLADSLSRRRSAARRALGAAAIVLVMLLVLLGLVVATFMIRHGMARSPAVP